MSENVGENKTKKSLILKFEYHGQQYELPSLTTGDTVENLRAVICSMLNINDFKKINLKTLQPTKVIDTSDDSKNLSEIFRGTRERIIVEDVCQQQASPSTSRQQQVKQQSTSSHIQSRSTSVKHHKPDSDVAVADQSSVANERDFSVFDDLSSNVSHDQHQFNLPEASNASSADSPVRQRKFPRDQTDYPVCSSTGYLLRHPVPSNNSCLFISVHFCLTNGVVDDQIGKSMRKIIADTVGSDKETFDDALLGKSNADYCKWILDDNNWGGAIELSILCKYYETEIVAIDVKNTVLARFGENNHYPQRMLLLYDGIHYDPLKFQPLDENHPVQTMFSTDNVEVLALAEELAREAKASNQYTDMNNLTMRCTSCNAELDPKTAREHASKTGHVDFIQQSDNTS